MSSTRQAPIIVVIGGGFSGTAAASHLLRRGRPVRVILVNRYGPIGRGVAYRTRIEAHVLNVPAAGMSALPDDPDDFLRFARERDSTIASTTFVSRRVYGEYLEHVLRRAEASAAPGATLERVVGEVRDVQPDGGGAGSTVVFADGSRRPADFVVLALGNYSPNDPPAEGAAFYATDRYVRDPWIRGALDRIREGEAVLMLGTGLTMMDIALDLAARGVRLPLRAVSRHGLLPHAHVEGATSGSLPPYPPALLEPPHTALRYLRAVRRLAAESGDWRAAFASLRPITPALWKQLSDAERARFLRHVRPFWDVHRHRAAPATASAVGTMLARSELLVRAARVVRYEPAPGAVRVVARPRGASEAEAVVVERVVNCTGPSSDVRRLGDRLLDALCKRRLAQPDPLGLGLEVSDDLALLDVGGRPSEFLFLVGPLLKARFWEATAVPELRQHAASVAERLLP